MTLLSGSAHCAHPGKWMNVWQRQGRLRGKLHLTLLPEEVDGQWLAALTVEYRKSTVADF